MEFKLLEEKDLELLNDVVEDDDMIFDMNNIKKFYNNKSTISFKDCASRKKTVLLDFAPSQVSIPFLTLLEKSVDTSPLLLICPYRVSSKIYIYLYRTHQYTSRFLLRPMFHLHCPFTLYSS